ncbi:MAG: insulinase family protein [Oscillospiraceae bacterium]|jgi:predicted Zn-dependent peptidase|nr:insulinase family protein [Oscillospiraceae bacterium]
MYEKITLSNGVRVVFERIDHVRSASLGVWVGAGSRHETAALSGASHFIEHMVFKGTATRTAAQLAQFMDSAGGQINAFTTKECTCFHGRVVDTRLGELTDVLGDMLLRSNFAESDIESERGVIFEEIDMCYDTPEELVSERLFEAVYRGGALARPILGRRATLSKMTGESLKAYMGRRYLGGSIVVALSGSFTDGDLRRVEEVFSAFPAGGGQKPTPASYSPARISKRKQLEQNHITLAFPGVSVGEERRYAMQMLSDILGGGMSSRLFQKVREERGLCYSIYSYASSYVDTGLFSVCTALGAEAQGEALGVILGEIRRLRDDGITAEELALAREQVEANVLMSLESTSARMNRLGRNELYFGKVLEPEETIARYEAVTAEDILLLARELLTAEAMSVSVIGRGVAKAEALDIPAF